MLDGLNLEEQQYQKELQSEQAEQKIQDDLRWMEDYHHEIQKEADFKTTAEEAK